MSDKLILCSDGLTTHVEEEEILELSKDYTPQEAAQKLVGLANERGGTDNITVLIAAADLAKNILKMTNSNE